MPQRQQNEMAAVVTGHSRGLGEAIADHLLSRDIRVLAISRRRNEELAARYRDRLTEVELDLADPEALTTWLESDALESFFGLAWVALLVNNAGVVQPVGPLETQDIATVVGAVVVNVAAPLALSAAFVSATAKLRDRRILHISSGAGQRPYSGWSVYCATKAALDHHARSVALDRTPALRIASVAPGVIDTEMQAEIRATTERTFRDRQRFVDMKREGQLIAPPRAGEAIVEFLLSSGFGDEPVTDLRRTGL